MIVRGDLGRVLAYVIAGVWFGASAFGATVDPRALLARALDRPADIHQLSALSVDEARELVIAWLDPGAPFDPAASPAPPDFAQASASTRPATSAPAGTRRWTTRRCWCW